MKNTNNRVCICCEKSFYFCPKCDKGKNTGVSINFDTEECKELVNAISGYNMKILSKEAVKAVLDKHNITDYTKYKQSIQARLNELFPVNTVEVPMNPPTKDLNETQAITEQNENESKEVKPQRKRKSRKKKVVLSDETEQRDQSGNGDNL